MKPFCCTAYRRCVTGATEYRFFRNSVAIGSAAAMVLPSFPVTIRAGDLVLQCTQDSEQTVFPGRKNTVFCEGQACAEVVYLEPGIHCLQIGTSAFHVIFRDGVWEFFQGGILAARMKGLQNRPPMEDDWERRLKLTVWQPLPEDQLILFLSFPLLQLGL